MYDTATMTSARGLLDGPASPEDAMRSLYDRHRDALFGYVLKLVASDRHMAADVVQETMLRAWRNGKAVHKTGNALPWLCTIARRIVIDGHRRRVARPTEANGAILDDIAGREEIEHMLTKVVVGEALASLSEQHRAVLLEVYYRRSNNEQAAQALGIPPGTVRSRCHYALRALRLALQERGVTGRL